MVVLWLHTAETKENCWRFYVFLVKCSFKWIMNWGKKGGISTSPDVIVPNLSVQSTFVSALNANLSGPVNNKNHRTPTCSLSCAHSDIVFPS